MAKDSIKTTIGARDEASAVLLKLHARWVATYTAMMNIGGKAISSTINAFRSMVGAALDSEKATARMDAALRSLGAYTPETAKQMRALAKAIKDETGASGTAVKEQIAQLLTLGVQADKMGSAVRAVEALKALGRDGAQAMVAVARAMEGNIDGFARLSPEVRNATTLEEKYAAANRLIQAGYAQQRASLDTVGGAWDALNGRLKEARIAIINAVFEGTRIGSTFNDAQAAVGKFLKSDTFAAFVGKIREAADYARQIMVAMTTDGGAKDVARGFGDIILGALKDGAEYVGTKISNAFSGAKSLFGESRVKLAVLAGTDEAEARRVVYGKPSEYQGGNMSKALSEFDKIVTSRAKTVDAAHALEKKQESIVADTVKPVFDMQKEKLTQANLEEEKTRRAMEIHKTELYIQTLTEQEARAKERKTRYDTMLADLAGQNLAEYIRGAQARRDLEKERGKDNDGQSRKIGSIFSRLGGNRGASMTLENLNAAIAKAEANQSSGRHLNKNDLQMLKDARQKLVDEKAARDGINQALKDAKELADKRQKWEATLQLLQEKAQKSLENIEKKIDQVLTDQGGF